MDQVPQGACLVGSVPLEDANQVFSQTAQILGSHLTVARWRDRRA